MGSTNAAPAALRMPPKRMTAKTNIEKKRFAMSGRPSPSVRATTALPPVPSMKPTAEISIATGNMMLTALRPMSPTMLDTKSPSATLYSEVRIIMAMLGSVKRSRRPKEKWSDSLICIKTSV